MKSLLIFLCHSLLVSAIAQTNVPTKQKVEQVIKITINQKLTDKNTSCANGLCGEWWANNKNGCFNKTDTIKIYNSSNFASIDSNYCSFRIWEFSSFNKFSQSGAEMCHEPPLLTFETNFDLAKKKMKRITPNKYLVLQKDSLVFIITYIDKVPFEKYKVIGIEQKKDYNENYYYLTLVRQHSIQELKN